MSDGGTFADWVSDNEVDLMMDFVIDNGKGVNLHLVSALIEHYGGLTDKPKTWVELVDALITRDRELESLYIQYLHSRYAEMCDRSMVLQDRENEI